MRRYIPVLLLLVFFVQHSYGQRGQNGAGQVIYIVDPCAVPWPKGSRPAPYPSQNPLAAANLKSIKTPNANKVNRANPRNYPNPNLAVKIKLISSYIHHVSDLKMVLVIKNETSREQTFVFDKYDGNSTILFETALNISNSHDRSVVKHLNKALLDTATYYKNIESYYYTLGPSEWLLKEYNVQHLVVLDTTICKKGKLPPGSYNMQLSFQGNLSNTVSFQAE